MSTRCLGNTPREIENGTSASWKCISYAFACRVEQQQIRKFPKTREEPVHVSKDRQIVVNSIQISLPGKMGIRQAHLARPTQAQSHNRKSRFARRAKIPRAPVGCALLSLARLYVGAILEPRGVATCIERMISHRDPARVRKKKEALLLVVLAQRRCRAAELFISRHTPFFVVIGGGSYRCPGPLTSEPLQVACGSMMRFRITLRLLGEVGVSPREVPCSALSPAYRQ